MSLSKEEFIKLGEAVQTIESVLGDLTLAGAVSLLAGIKAGGDVATDLIYSKLEEIEASCD